MGKYPTSPAAVAIGDLAWLAGAWQGTRGEDGIEEHWSAPAGNGIMGMFRWLRDGQARFYELMTIEQEGEEVLLRIKHFNPGLIAWEEKEESVTFVVVGASEGEAILAKRGGERLLWIVYRRPDPDTLITYFEGEDGTHKPEDEFRYRRLPTNSL